MAGINDATFDLTPYIESGTKQILNAIKDATIPELIRVIEQYGYIVIAPNGQIAHPNHLLIEDEPTETEERG